MKTDPVFQHHIQIGWEGKEVQGLLFRVGGARDPHPIIGDI